ncbi:hypothetical protein MKW94_007501, partial [Papaver nudicaule]|nr:hypothetical protein [Papaver nudicaule]
MVGVKMEAEVRRSGALFLMKHNDYVDARNKLLDAQKLYAGLEYIDELIKVCDLACAAESESGIDWYSVLQTNKTADAECNYTELIRTMEPVKNKFPEIKSALRLIRKSYSVLSNRKRLYEFYCRRDGSLGRCGTFHCRLYEFHCRRDGSLGRCGSVRPLDIAQSETVNVNREATSQGSSGTKRNVRGGLICNSHEQPLKRVTSLGGVNCQTQSHNKPKGKVCRQEASLDTAENKSGLNGTEGSLGTSSGSRMKAMVHKEPNLQFYDLSNHKKADALAVGQFLAFYDQEKMPRLYAQIDRIESYFEKKTNSREKILYIRWLRPAPVDPDEKQWHAVGLPVSCGFFKLDSNCNIVVGSRLLFSHLVSPLQEYCYPKEVYQICPREGEVWALYKEWKPFDWYSDPKTRGGCKFQFVEILSNYSKDAGPKVAILVKVAGGETIFRRSGFSSQISARNLFRFSHNIPVSSVAGERDVFSGKLFKLDPLLIPEEVVVVPVEAEFSYGSSVNRHNSRSPRTTSDLNPEKYKVNECAGGVALSSVDQNGKQLNATSLRLVSPGTCEKKKNQADGTSENISLSNWETDGSSKELVGNLSAENDKEKVAEQIDSESDRVNLGGSVVNESECGNSSRNSADAVNKLDISKFVAL